MTDLDRTELDRLRQQIDALQQDVQERKEQVALYVKAMTTAWGMAR